MVNSAIQLPAWAEPLFQPRRYKSMRGGRGSAKSHTAAAALLIKASERPLRIGCFREFQNSINDSVHTLLKKKIADMGLGSFFTPLETSIRGRNGSEFIYGGLRTNLQSIKSKEDIDIAWVEEAQVVSEKSWELLIPTIRKSGSEIWLTWNPELDEDPTNQRFVVSPPPGILDLVVNWQDNPWFPDELRDEMLRLYAQDPEAAEHIWGGKTRRVSNAQILRGRYIVASFEASKDWSGPHQGLDFGFATTPMAFTRSWIDGRKLYLEYEATGLEIDIDDQPAKLKTVPRAADYVTRADNSRPENINHLRRHGFPKMLPCSKGSGSIEGGVEFLRSFEQIIIHPRCELAIQQARLYSFKVDKLSGDVKPDIEDKHNDIWDSVRYALEPVIAHGLAKTPVKTPPKPAKHDYRGPPKQTESWKTR